MRDRMCRRSNTSPAEDAKDSEIEQLKAALKDMCELWVSMGKQIPPLLNEKKYLNAAALAGTDNNVGTKGEKQ